MLGAYCFMATHNDVECWHATWRYDDDGYVTCVARVDTTVVAGIMSLVELDDIVELTVVSNVNDANVMLACCDHGTVDVAFGNETDTIE